MIICSLCALHKASLVFTMLSCLGPIISFWNIDEHKPKETSAKPISYYDWGLMAQVLIPSFIIGIGAGLTIPFVNLFFLQVFGVAYDEFAMVGSVSTLMVTMASMYGPRLRKRYGYKAAITMPQTLAVLALVALGCTEQFSGYWFALPLAITFYLLRQPLMNMSNPIIASFAMEFVGEKNREVTSASQQALWAGSWFFSTQIFRALRSMGYSYTVIFICTAIIYGIGIIWYHLLLSKEGYTRLTSSVQT